MVDQRGQFSTLLATLIFTLVGLPFLDRSFVGLPITQILFSAVFMAGVFAVSRERAVLIGGSVLAVIALLLTWWRHLTESTGALVPVLDYATDVAFFGYVAFVVMRIVLEQKRVTSDTIYGGICVYLLIGMIWTVFFSAIEYFEPGSFVLGSEAIAELDASGREPALFRELIYFSMVTLTTLGYGDIRPTTDIARALSTAEAAVGQLFVAVFIARLVGLYLVHASQDDE
jgi:hypothetical protein